MTDTADTSKMFDPLIVRVNMAWANAAFGYVCQRTGILAPHMRNFLLQTRSVKSEYIYDVYQYISPLYDQMQKYVRAEESSRFSKAYLPRVAEAETQIRRIVERLENEANQATLRRLMDICAAR